MKRKLLKLLLLSGADRFLLIACLAVVAVVRLGLALLSYRTVQRLAPGAESGLLAGPDEIRRVAWGVETAANFVPHATCLTQALAGQILLAFKGRSSKVRLGVGQDANGKFLAHAWLLSGDRVVLGGTRENIARFTPLADLRPAGS